MIEKEKSVYQAYVDGFNDGLMFALKHLRELKELLIGLAPQSLPVSSSNKPKTKLRVNLSDNLDHPKPMKKYHKEAKPNNQKITLEQIKEIKALAESGMDNKRIAERLGIKPSLIPYWRKNTPKEL